MTGEALISEEQRVQWLEVCQMNGKDSLARYKYLMRVHGLPDERAEAKNITSDRFAEAMAWAKEKTASASAPAASAPAQAVDPLRKDLF